MAFRSFSQVVGATPVELYTAQPGDVDVWIRVTNYEVSIGGSDAQTFRIDGSEEFHSKVRPGDQIFAVRSTSSNVQTHVLVRSA